MPISNKVLWRGVVPSDPEESIPIKRGAEEKLATANTPADLVAIDTTSTTVLSANADRVSFMLRNTGSIDVYFRLGDDATTNDMLLEEGDCYFNDDYTGVVDAIVASGAGEIRTIET